MIPPSWVDSACKEILALPEGETLAASQIIDRVRKKIISPDTDEWWLIPLGEAECMDKLEYTGKCQRFVDYLPRNPVYITKANPEPEPLDFWGQLKEGAAK